MSTYSPPHWQPERLLPHAALLARSKRPISRLGSPLKETNHAKHVSFFLAGGRLFVDHTPETLHDSLADVPINIIETWISNDLRPNRI
jgi:hypothetical protein